MKYVYSFLLRVVLCFVPLGLFNALLVPLTLYVSYWLLIPAGASLVSDVIFVGGYSFEIVGACVASLGFYLIWVLMLLTKDVSLKKRIGLFLGGSVLLFIMNVIRIVVLVAIALNYGMDTFNSVHLIFWYIVSGVYVAFIWVVMVSALRVKSIPVVDDVKKLIRIIRKN